MRKIFLSALLMLFMVSSFAQKTERNAEADTQVLVDKLQLTDAQEAKVLKIQNRKYAHRAQIAQLEDTDLEKYIAKMSANEQQTRHAVKIILTKEQGELLKKDRYDLRVKKANLSLQMQKEGASATEIKRALLDVEMEH